MSILAIDAGTTGVTALVVSDQGLILAKGYQEFEQHFPEPGWVEHDLEDIWQATLSACKAALTKAAVKPTAIGITNQRETIALWNKSTLQPARKAIVWQDRRTSSMVAELKAKGLEQSIKAKTGLGLDPYFSSTKLLWLSKHEKALWSAVKNGGIRLGTIDSFLIAKLTAGKAHVTDASNASRTQLLNIHTGLWDDELLEIFDVPKIALPEVMASYGTAAETEPETFLGLRLPIAGIAGDQQAALFGQAAFEVGDNKCTYGTGAFILTNTGSVALASSAGLLTTIAWQAPSGELTYALEGSVFVAGAAVQWLRDGLKIINKSSDVEDLAGQVSSSSGVVFVPALTGLGAPHWQPNARGTIFGLTRGTTDAHIARATLEAIVYQIRDVIDAIKQDAQINLGALYADGGAAANGLLLQLQADQLGIPVMRGKNIETTGLGAAFLAGLGTGVWSNKEELKSVFQLDRRFEPKPTDPEGYKSWARAVELCKSWTEIS